MVKINKFVRKMITYEIKMIIIIMIMTMIIIIILIIYVG